jgi:hypothetical protein
VFDGLATEDGFLFEYEREIACSGPSDCVCPPDAGPGPGVEGDACRTDCSCGAGLSCVGEYGMAGATWTCLRPCNDFLDCGAYESCLEPVPDGIPWVCVGWLDQCSVDRPCPDGFDCVTDTADAPNECIDRRDGARREAASCECDLDCARGERCLLPASGEAHCGFLCRRDVECPGRGEVVGGRRWSCSATGACEATSVDI